MSACLGHFARQASRLPTALKNFPPTDHFLRLSVTREKARAPKSEISTQLAFSLLTYRPQKVTSRGENTEGEKADSLLSLRHLSLFSSRL